MKNLADFFRRLRGMIDEGRECALATVISRRGSGPREAGAMMFFDGAGALGTGTRSFFLYPGDVPFVRPATLTRMLKNWRKQDADMVRPRFHERGGHPVLLAARIPSILSFRGEVGLRDLVREQALTILDEECGDPGILTDLDTPDHYERALRQFRPAPPEPRSSLEP